MINLIRLVFIDIITIVLNFKHIRKDRIGPFLFYKYVQKPDVSRKELAALHYNIINFELFKPDFITNLLKKYWIEYRYYLEVEKHLGPVKNQKVLDIGCGYTSILNFFSGKNKYGVDIIIPHLIERGFPLDESSKWIQGRAELLPFKEHFFDIVITSNALDHVDSPKVAIDEASRILKSGGFFVFCVDVFDEDKGKRDVQHPFSFTEKQLFADIQDDFEMIFSAYDHTGTGFKTFFLNHTGYFIEKIINRKHKSHAKRKISLVLRKK